MTKYILRTYQVVTPESAEHGETSEHGYADFSGNHFPMLQGKTDFDFDPNLIGYDCTEDSDDTSVDIVCECLLSQGVEPSASFFHPNVWYAGYPETDYRDGSDTTYSYHLYGFSEAEQLEIYQSVTRKTR